MHHKHTRIAPLRAIAAVTLLVMALSATALAVSRPDVLNWLLGSDPASEPLQSAVQTVLGEGTADGVTVCVTNVVYDGENLVFSYEAENADPASPVFVAAQPVVLLNGHEAYMQHCTADPSMPQLVPSPHLDVLPVRRNPAAGGGVISAGAVTGDRITCEMTFSVCRPENGLAIFLHPDSMQANIDSYTGDARAEAEDSLRTLQSYQQAHFVDASDFADPQWLAGGYTVIDGSGMLLDLPENSCLRESAQITVSFSFDASSAFLFDASGMSDIQLPDCTLHVERFRFSPLETCVDISLIPTENTRAAASALAETYDDFALLGDDSAPVVYSSMDYMAGFAPSVRQVKGQWICRYQAELPGLAQFPYSIAFAAGGAELFRLDLPAAE